ncbi:MAG: nitrogen regulatory protein P-II 1 [Candidatus Marinamargulisbacteria bacterium]|jgi:nitrogen regulatory protein P-II 1
MAKQVNSKGYTLITAILRKGVAESIMSKGVLDACRMAVVINARGTLAREKWYQRLLPIMHPEQEILELLAPNEGVDSLMSYIIQAGGLQRYGSGTIYCMPCEKAIISGPEKKAGKEKFPKNLKPVQGLKEDLTAIFCILQRNKADSLAKSVIEAGTPGPSIAYGIGRGIRDRLGLIRLAINPEKELMRVVVDSIESEPIFDLMIREGRLHIPGEGFIYMVKLQKGLVNMSGVYSRSVHSASIPEIIKALDELKGTASWRQRVSYDESQGEVKERKYLENLTRLTCVSSRANGEAVIQAALSAGAPGASVSYGVALGEEKRLGNSKIMLNNEKEMIEFTLAPNKVTEVLSAIQKAEKGLNGDTSLFYTHKVPKAYTYLGPSK